MIYMYNPTGTRRGILYRNRQGVGLYSIKQIENGKMGMKSTSDYSVTWITQMSDLTGVYVY